MAATIVPGTGSRRAYFPKYKINQGPYSGGLNTVDDPTSLGENELQDCINFNLRPDGVLRSRAPVVSSDTGLPTLNANILVTALGSSIRPQNGFLVPLVALVDFTHILTLQTDFYFWNGSTWAAAFNSKSHTEGTSPTGSTGIFVKVIVYRGIWYALSTQAGLYSISGGFGTDLTYEGPSTKGGLPVAGVDMVIVKDRLFIHDGQNLFWSKATDPTDWGADANVLITSGSTGDLIRRMIVFQDSIWLIKNSGIWRLSFTDNPQTNGVFEQISTTGGYDAEVYNSDLYIINGNGIYKLVSGYFSEVSQKIRNVFREASTKLVFNGVPVSTSLYNKIGLFCMGPYLVAGPFNTIVPIRFGEPNVVDEFVGNAYFVLDLDTGTFVKWQFSPNSTTNPVSGPTQTIMPLSVSNPAAPDSYVWVGLGPKGAGTPAFDYIGHTYQVDAVNLVTNKDQPNVGVDTGPTGAFSWIGGLIRLGAINLGDSTMWKRVFTATLDAKFNSDTAGDDTFPHGASAIGFDVDGVKQKISIPVRAQRLIFGKAFRCREFNMFYDSITGIANTTSLKQAPELTDVNTFFSWVQVSEKDTATGPGV